MFFFAKGVRFSPVHPNDGSRCKDLVHFSAFRERRFRTLYRFRFLCPTVFWGVGVVFHRVFFRVLNRLFANDLERECRILGPRHFVSLSAGALNCCYCFRPFADQMSDDYHANEADANCRCVVFFYLGDFRFRQAMANFRLLRRVPRATAPRVGLFAVDGCDEGNLCFRPFCFFFVCESVCYLVTCLAVRGCRRVRDLGRVKAVNANRERVNNRAGQPLWHLSASNGGLIQGVLSFTIDVRGDRRREDGFVAAECNAGYSSHVLSFFWGSGLRPFAVLRPAKGFVQAKDRFFRRIRRLNAAFILEISGSIGDVIHFRLNGGAFWLVFCHAVWRRFCALGFACRVGAQFRNLDAFLPFDEAGLAVVDNCGLNDFCLAGGFVDVAPSTIILGFDWFSLTFKVRCGDAAVDRAIFFGRRAGYAQRDAYEVYRRQVDSFTSAFEHVVPYFVGRV